MRKAIYSCCPTDPWVDVAALLQREVGLQPIYWIGWPEDNCEEVVRRAFPAAIYHDLSVAWKGVFPPEMAGNEVSVPLDQDFLEKNARHELMTLRMMDSFDPDGRAFPFGERQRHYRKLAKYWLSVVDSLEPDILIAPAVPHRVFDYVLYTVCAWRGIRVLMYQWTPFLPVIIPLDCIDRMPDELRRTYAELLERGDKDPPLNEQMVAKLNTYRGRYTIAEPAYMKSHKEHSTIDNGRSQNGTYSVIRMTMGGLGKASSLLRRNPVKAAREYRNSVICANKSKKQWLGSPGKSHLKEPSKEIEESQYLVRDELTIRTRGNQYKSELKALYREICVAPDLSQPFVLFALHYQPEEATCPSGQVFVDQLRAIEIISASLPDSWTLYVKEHIAQFSPMLRGEIGRPRSFYHDALLLPNVRFVDIDYDPFDLVDRARAVATITGTIGWEALARGKPVLIFGRAWYEYCHGVFRISSTVDCELAISGIKAGLEVNEHHIVSYLKAVQEVGIRAYYHFDISGRQLLSKAECLENYVRSVKNALSDAYCNVADADLSVDDGAKRNRCDDLEANR